MGQIIGSGNSQSYWSQRGSSNNSSNNNSNNRNNNSNNSQQYHRRSPLELANQLKTTVRSGLISRGVHGFISLLRSFEDLDKSDRGGYDGNLPLAEFYKVLRDSGFNVTEEQCRSVYATLDLTSGTDEADELDYR